MSVDDLPGRGTWLVHGVRLRGQPVLAYGDRAHDGRDSVLHEVGLAGRRLSYRIADDIGWCLGYRDADGNQVPCRDDAPAVRAHRCLACESADPFRWMHIVHRSAYVDPALRSKMMRPHWLYVASFGAGLHKVGTATDERRWQRIAEQGALAAEYIALAADGLEVRRLEDLVSAHTQLGQVVRPAAKAAALAAGATRSTVRQAQRQAAQAARDLLVDHGVTGVVYEPWHPERDLDELLTEGLLAGRPKHRFPGRLDEGDHGFTVRAVLGQAGLVQLDDDLATIFVADLSVLTGRRITGADSVTPAPAVQDELF